VPTITDKKDWCTLKEKVRKGLCVWSNSRDVCGEGVFVVMEKNMPFLEDALARGATHLVIDSSLVDFLPQHVFSRLPAHRIFVVEDAPSSLGELASVHYGTQEHNYLLIGITGTNGKTTCSYLLEHLFLRAGKKVGVIGTVNYRWLQYSLPSSLTTPACLELHSLVSRMISKGVEVVIMEVSSHALSQDRVAGFVFDVAVFTNLSHDHLDYHRDIQEYFDAKSRLFRHYLSPSGTAVINLEDTYGNILFNEDLGVKRKLGYALSPDISLSDAVRGEIVEMHPRGMRVVTSFRGRRWEVSLPLIGRHNAMNLLAVEATGVALDLDVGIFNTLGEIRPIPGRLERIDNPLDLNILVDYAHTPDALEKVLSSLKDMDFDRLIVVFGCGGDRDKSKRPVMGEVVCRYADVAILTSDNPRFEDPELIIKEVYAGMNREVETIIEVDRRRAINRAISLMDKRDVLLIAGKGHEDYQEIRGKRYPFSDKEVVLEYLGS